MAHFLHLYALNGNFLNPANFSQLGTMLGKQHNA
jgi:hypothetical protein